MASRAFAGKGRRVPWRPPDLRGRVAVVAGATRGAGRGIALALGEAGATVYCTGRSVTGKAATKGRPETIQETADLVDSRGGTGVAVRVDHREEAQVKRLFKRVDEESGRLDVLVNDIWGGDALVQWGQPFWALDVQAGLQMMRTAIDTHIITARHGTPLLLKGRSGRRGRAKTAPPGLLVEITDGDGYEYRGNLFYDLVKTSVIRLAFAYAYELRDRNVASVAVTPGFLRSEAMLEHFGVTKDDWQKGAKKDPNFIASESPLFVGRAIASLAGDRDVMRRTGRAHASWTLAREHGFPDEDGSRPDWGRHYERSFGVALEPLDDRFYKRWWPHAFEAAMGGQD